MTLEELEDTLPNGFHDCYLHKLDMDFAAQSATLEIEVDFNDSYRLVSVVLTGLRLVILEPPELTSDLRSLKRLEACGQPTEEAMLAGFDEYSRRAPKGAFFYSFWLPQLTSNIHLSALDARMEPA